MDKSRSASISLPESYWKRLKEIADDQHGGNKTKAVKAMIDGERTTAAPTANDPSLLLKLFEQYQPLLVDDLKAALKANPAKDQKRIMAYMLDGLLDYLMHYYDGTASRLAIMPDKTARDIITAIQQLPPAHELDISEYYGEAELANQAQQDAELVAKEHRDNILHGKPFSHQHTKELAAEDQHPYNKPNHGTEKPA